jgi:hypothetical protein
MNSTITLTAGDFVTTPEGPGRVVYVRMLPPDYATIAAISVYLESKRGQFGYTGTMCDAASVKAVA